MAGAVKVLELGNRKLSKRKVQEERTTQSFFPWPCHCHFSFLKCLISKDEKLKIKNVHSVENKIFTLIKIPILIIFLTKLVISKDWDCE